jgi:hypothetical protein
MRQSQLPEIKSDRERVHQGLSWSLVRETFVVAREKVTKG